VCLWNDLSACARRALHQILVTRRRNHEPTIAYIERRISEGKTRREANRCLKRYLARGLFRLLENGAPPTLDKHRSITGAGERAG
jgi:transposase